MESNWDICGSFNGELYNQFNPEQAVNMYLVQDPDGKKPTAMFQTQGRKLLFNLSTAAYTRSLASFKDYLYAVCGQEVYQINTVYNVNRISTSTQLNTTAGYVGIDANQNNQVIFVDGFGGYILDNNASTFTKITDANFPASPTDVVYLDGFFIANNANTAQFYLSALNNGKNWTPQKFASLTVQPDIIIGFGVLRRQLFIFGNSCTEVWENQGFGDFPFRRTFTLSYGCAAVQTISQGYEHLFWLARTPEGNLTVVATDGTAPAAVSSRQIESRINDYKTSSDAVGYVFKEDGFIFYKLIFPTENESFLLNFNTKQWSELEEIDGGRDASQCHAYFNHIHMVGLYNDSNLYELSNDYPTNNGDAIRRMRIPRIFSDPNYHRIRINRIELDVVGGEGTVTGNDEEPVVFLGISYDGGVTYPYYEKQPMPKLGEFRRRVIWRRLGTSRAFAFKVEHFNQTDFTILGGTIHYEVLPR